MARVAMCPFGLHLMGFLCLWTANCVRPKMDESSGGEGKTSVSSMAVAAAASMASPSSGAAGSNTSQVSAKSSNRSQTFCDLVHYAIPELGNVSMVTDPVGEACDLLGLEAAQCRTSHSLWSCIPEAGACKCKWRPFCHGVDVAVKSGAKLACRPNLGYGTCQCWAFKECPAQSGRWRCFHSAQATNDAQDNWQMHEADFLRFNLAGGGSHGDVSNRGANLSKLEEELLRAGSCHCKQESGQVHLPLNPLEEEALMKSAWGPLFTSQNATAAGIPIENKQSNTDDSGKTRLALTINPKKQLKKPADQPSAKQQSRRTSPMGFGLSLLVGPAVPREEVPEDIPEHCVITDGVVTFSKLHIAVLSLMMLPVALVLILIVCCNSGMLLNLWLGRRSGFPSAFDPGARRSSFGTPRTMPPQSLTLLLVLLMVLMKINVTSVLTTAHVIIDGLKSKGAFSTASALSIGDLQVPAEGLAAGLLLASEPFGGIFGVLLVGAYRLRKPKETVVASCVIVLFCSLGFLLALRISSLSLMILLRFISGLGEGSLYLGHVYLARLSAPDVRTKIFGYWELGTAAGLVSGPALASFLASGPWAQILPGPGEAMAACIAILAFFLMVTILVFFPCTSELCEDGAVGARPLAGAALTDRAWTVQLTLSGSTIVRLLLRLAWEAAAAIVLATHFCLGHKMSGYGITLTFFLYMAAQSLFVTCCEKFSDHALIRSCEFLELIGLVLMFRAPSDVETTLMEDVMGSSAFIRLAQFLFGSALFYTGNCLTSAPLSSWATKFGPGSESVMFFAHLAIQCGVFAGGLLSRVFTSMDPHQNMIVAMLLPVVCLQILLSELGIGITALSDARPGCQLEEE